MRGFVQRALKKLSKLDSDQLYGFIQDLAKEHEQLAVVLDSLNEGVMVSDNKNNLIFYNKAAERLLPISPFEVFSHPLWEAILDRDIAALVRSCLISQESVQDKEFTLDTDSQHRMLSISLIPLVQEGKIQGTILIARDVSEKRIREARLRRAESLASLTTLAAGVAHEIKNPLGSIGIHIQLIQKILTRSACDYPKEVDNHLKVVNEEVDRLNRIVMDFLFAVRPMDINLESGDVNHLVEDLIKFMSYELEEAKILTTLSLDEKLPSVPMDERFIKQALLNVIKNAMAAMPEGGQLSVETSRGDKEVRIGVTDSGVGMSQAVQDKIFEPFFTTKDFGSGIGLTLVYKILKEHGGEVSVKSQEGKGSTFILSLPIPQKERALLCWDEGWSDPVEIAMMDPGLDCSQVHVEKANSDFANDNTAPGASGAEED